MDDSGETAQRRGPSGYFPIHELFQTADKIQLTHSAAETERTMSPQMEIETVKFV